MSAPLTRDEVQAQLDVSPFIRFLGLTVAAMDPEAGRIALSMPMRAETERLPGSNQFHGGAIAALIDCAGDYALVMGLGGPVPTIDLRVDFLRPSLGPALLATATVRRAGRTIGVVDIDVTDGQDRLVATGRGVYAMAVG
jgi:uncharacterized protein (TIGR00369 family)